MGYTKARKRVAQACQRCRQRKFKCDGQKPECSTCIQATETCEYDSHMRRRGLPEGYVRGLELLVSLAIHHLDNFEEHILTRLLQRNKENHFEWQYNFDNLLDEWKNSKLLVEIEGLLPSLPTPKSLPVKRKFRDNQAAAEGPSRFLTSASTPRQITYTDRLYEPLRDSSDVTTSHAALGENPISDNQLLQEATGMVPSRQLSEQRSNDIKLPAQLGRLVRIYFSQTHCWLPIVDKAEIMRSTYCFVNGNPDTNLKRGSLALVWAITASTTSQLLKSGHLAEFFETDNLSEDLVRLYYMKARELIPSEEGPFKIEHVQALLLLSLIKLDQSAWSAAWLLIGKAVQIAIDLDFLSAIVRADSRSIEQQKQTLLGCFILDTLLSFYLSRPPHLRDEDADRVGNIDEDGLDEWDIWSNPLDTTRSSQPESLPLFMLSTFNQLVRICKVIQPALIAQVYNKPYPQAISLESLATENARQPFDSIFKAPGTPTFPENSMLPHHYHLRLIYLATIAETRPISSLITNNEHAPSSAQRKSACIAEIRTLIKELGDRFGLHAIPQTCPLIVAIVSRPDSIIDHDSGVAHPNPPINTMHPSQESTRRDRGIRHGFPEMHPGDSELQHHDSLTDSNSIFNDFVAIDTSEWTSNWTDGLFNLGFAADSSAKDFYDFCEPNT